MKNVAIKKYLLSANIGQNEIELIQGMIQENDNSLEDYLPENEKPQILTKFLSSALCMYEENKNFIKNIVSVHPLKYKAVSEYFLTINIGENEIKLLQKLIKDNGNTLNDYILEDYLITYNISNIENNKRTYILSKLLKSALSKYEVYENFAQEILSLHDNTNKIAFYWALVNDINGLKLIKENSHYNITDDQLEESINKNIDLMFKYEHMYITNAEIIFPNWSKAALLLQDERMKKAIIKEYFSPKRQSNGMYAYNEEDFFKHLGLTKKSILNDNILSKYKNDFSRLTVGYIAERLNFNTNEKQHLLLDFTLPDKKDSNSKNKI